jgi:hypothetical protein
MIEALLFYMLPPLDLPVYSMQPCIPGAERIICLLFILDTVHGDHLSRPSLCHVMYVIQTGKEGYDGWEQESMRTFHFHEDSTLFHMTL